MTVSTDVRRPAAIQQLAVGVGAGRRDGVSAGDDGPGCPRHGRAGRGEGQGVRHRARRHRRPPAHRRRADGRTAGDQGRGVAVRPALRRGLDDRAGRHQERRRVQPPHGRDRRGPDQARWRRPRWRGAVGRVGGRRADRVRRQRRTARGSRGLSSDRIVSRIRSPARCRRRSGSGRRSCWRTCPRTSRRRDAPPTPT